jgi:ribosomal protein S18 acetylase RimI-like enzyme
MPAQGFVPSASPSEPATAGFALRLATPDDFTAVGEITVRGYEHDGLLRASDSYAERLRDAAHRAAHAELWVAAEESSGTLLGTVTFCPVGSTYRELATASEGEFRMLAVDPAARGRGVGKALVRTCLERSRALRFTAVVLCSLPTMTAAHALYAALGFERMPERDWSPAPGVVLWGFRAALSGSRPIQPSG